MTFVQTDCLLVCRTEHDQDTRPEPSSTTAVSDEAVAPSANTSPDVAGETAAGRQNDGAEAKAELKEEEEVVEEEERKEMVVEEEEEARKDIVADEAEVEEEEEVQETPTGDGSDAISREVCGKEEQPAGESHCGEAGDEEPVLAHGGPGSRSVTRHLFVV